MNETSYEIKMYTISTNRSEKVVITHIIYKLDEQQY